MPRGGGPRPNAGRKPIEEKRTNHSIKFTESEWIVIQNKAASENLTASDYIRKVSLNAEIKVNVKEEK